MMAGKYSSMYKKKKKKALPRTPKMVMYKEKLSSRKPKAATAKYKKYKKVVKKKK